MEAAVQSQFSKDALNSSVLCLKKIIIKFKIKFVKVFFCLYCFWLNQVWNNPLQ